MARLKKELSKTTASRDNRTSTEKVAEFVASLAYDDIPDSAASVAKNAFLDWLGVAIAGSKEPSSRIIAEYARKTAARNEASAICQGFMTTAELAALVNGTTGHALDYDDTFPSVVHYNMHPSACVVPAVLSVAEKHRLSGRKALAAYVAGMEVIYCVGSAIGESIPQSGWHPTPVIGTMGTAAGCANILGLSLTQVQYALGIAASLAGGLLKNFGSMTKTMHAGNAARNGVIAAELAADGFTSNSSIFDDDYNFSQMFGSKQLSRLLDAERHLGKVWRLVSEGIGFKLYPSCRSTHSSIDATLYLRKKFNIRAEQVAEITCTISHVHTELARFHKPETGYQGKFSIPYCVATALRNGSISLEDFTDDKVKDPKAQELLAKVNFQHPPELDKGAMDLTAEIAIRLNNGAQYSHRVSLPKGEPENPMTDEELAIKFETCSSLIFNKRDVHKILNLIKHMEEVVDLTELFEVLREPEGLGKRTDR